VQISDFLKADGRLWAKRLCMLLPSCEGPAHDPARLARIAALMHEAGPHIADAVLCTHPQLAAPTLLNDQLAAISQWPTELQCSGVQLAHEAASNSQAIVALRTPRQHRRIGSCDIVAPTQHVLTDSLPAAAVTRVQQVQSLRVLGSPDRNAPLAMLLGIATALQCLHFTGASICPLLCSLPTSLVELTACAGNECESPGRAAATATIAQFEVPQIQLEQDVRRAGKRQRAAEPVD
jgi:hypothetical protein